MRRGMRADLLQPVRLLSRTSRQACLDRKVTRVISETRAHIRRRRRSVAAAPRQRMGRRSSDHLREVMMTKVSLSTKLPVSADKVWKTIGGFYALPHWLPAGQERKLPPGGAGPR